MASVGRLAGALLVATQDAGGAAWFLVGDTKVPCDWDAAGFARPADRDAARVRYVRLAVTGAPRLAGPTLRLAREGEDAARLIADRLLVARNGAVSERLWRLVFGLDDDDRGDARDAHDAHDARWLDEVPQRVWDVVREAVLKCT